MQDGNNIFPQAGGNLQSRAGQPRPGGHPDLLGNETGDGGSLYTEMIGSLLAQVSTPPLSLSRMLSLSLSLSLSISLLFARSLSLSHTHTHCL